MLKSDSPRLTQNNFDLLRLLFAITVCVVHIHTLSEFKQLEWIANVFSSVIAVKAFFVVSGFLIFMSFERSSSFRTYANKRLRRIYPAYFTVVMFCALSLLFVSLVDIHEYFSFAWFEYVLSNLVFMNFLHPSLPGVFENNNVIAVNGALWTLKIEVMFYLAVPFFVYLFRKFSHFPVLVLVYCLSVAYALLFQKLAEQTDTGIYMELSRQLPGQLSYFMSGAFLYYFLPLFERQIKLFVTAAVFIFIVSTMMPISFLEPFALAVIVVYFGLFLYLGNVGKYGDFSYGIYILHFPIIQVLLYTGAFQESPWYFLIAVLVVTILGAIALWHLIEKRFLFRRSHYIRRAT